MQPSPSALARLVDGFAAEGIRFGRRQTTTRSLRLGERAVPTLEKKGTLRALVRQQPFVSIGRRRRAVGALDFKQRHRRFSEMGARFAAGSRTAAARRPYPRKRGRFAPWCGSTLRVNW